MQAEQAKFFLDMLLPALENESKITRTVLTAVPDARRDYKPDPKARSAFELAWHIVSSEVWFLDGVVNGQFAEEPAPPPEITTVAGVIAWYDKHLPPAVARVKALPDEKLAQPIAFYGILNHPAVVYLTLLNVHSVHHRGQLSTYLRPMGGKVPSIYGGSADEPFQM